MSVPLDEPLIIVGSRLQALIFAVSAGAIGVGFWDRFGALTLVAAVPLLLATALTLHRRVELHADLARIRHQFRPTQTIARNEADAEAGHRYLRVRSESASIRIEVPVEIRPEVRDWTEGRR